MALRGWDELGLPDAPLRFRVLTRPRRGVRLVREQGGETAAEAVTDASGWAWLAPGGVLGCGLHRFVAQSGEDSLPLVALVAPADRPLVVVDIDRTLSAPPSFYASVAKPAWIAPLPGAADAMSEIARGFGVVYLTARNQRFMPNTRAWLRAREFPEGPIFLRQVPWWRLPSGRYKTRWLAALTGRWRAVRFGIGDKTSDAVAYARAGITPILLLRSRRARGVPAQTCMVRTWAEVRARVLG